MQDIIAFRGLEALRTSSAMSTEIAQLAQSDNKLMLSLTTKSQRDARSLKTITILTMIYLPASFASVSHNQKPSDMYGWLMRLEMSLAIPKHGVHKS